MTAAPFNDRIDGFPDSIQQPHLCYRRDIGTLSVPPQVKDRFRHRRSRLPCVVQRKGVHVPVQCPDVGRRPLCDTEAVGECRRSNVPQVNRIAVPFRSFTAFGIKDNRYCPLPRLFILRIGQCRAVLAENMPRTYRRIGYVDMGVTGSAQYRRHYHCNPLNLSYHVISVFLFFLYFIGSFTPSTIPVRSKSAPFIIMSLLTCQYSVHPDRSS